MGFFKKLFSRKIHRFEIKVKAGQYSVTLPIKIQARDSVVIIEKLTQIEETIRKMVSSKEPEIAKELTDDYKPMEIMIENISSIINPYEKIIRLTIGRIKTRRLGP
jgi:hypothetical protein